MNHSVHYFGAAHHTAIPILLFLLKLIEAQSVSTSIGRNDGQGT